LQLATRSIEPSFGLLFGDLLKDLDVGTTGAAIIISMLDIMMNLSGLFVGPLLKEFSYRKVAIIGSLLCALGLALTAPATSMAHILTTYSVINGKHFLFSRQNVNGNFSKKLFSEIFVVVSFRDNIQCQSISFYLIHVGKEKLKIAIKLHELILDSMPRAYFPTSQTVEANKLL
jgi:MFS family permease